MDRAVADDLIDWVLDNALQHHDIGSMIATVGERLCAAGLPLLRLSVSLPTIDPNVRAITYSWRRGKGARAEHLPHGPEQVERFQRSVIYDLRQQHVDRARYRLERGEGTDRFELLREMREWGATDYLLRLVPFGDSVLALEGVAFSAASDQPGGFDDSQCVAINRLVPALALAVFRISVTRIARDALAVYLGPQSGRRVLAGQIRRGEGERISAALLTADLKGFTNVSEREEAVRVVGWLNEHFEAIGDAVNAQGGEILKFMGDGLLAVFPGTGGSDYPCPICERALAAAQEAIAANRALNDRRATSGGPTLDVDVVLHFGDVIYGNVGATRRLDFTVIGRAVNEASRMEALCDVLGVNLLISEAFARRIDRALVDLGAFPLRGIVGERRVFKLLDR